MRTSLVLIAVFSFLMLGLVSQAQADGCYICKGGSYVKYSGGDDQSKRSAAKACGCEISGTRSECEAANLQILCSVQKEIEQSIKVAQKK